LLQGNLNVAKAKYEEDLKIERRLVNQFPKDRNLLANLAVAVSRMADVLQAHGDLDGSKTQYASAVDVTEQLLKQNSGDAQLRRDLAVDDGKLGGILVAQRDFSGAKIKYTSVSKLRTGLPIRISAIANGSAI
jgi:tetratricopeptide (TPR) repeat protein